MPDEDTVPKTAPDTDAEAFDLCWRVAQNSGSIATLPVIDQDTARTVYRCGILLDFRGGNAFSDLDAITSTVPTLAEFTYPTFDVE